MFRFAQHDRKIHRDERRAMNAEQVLVYSDSAISEHWAPAGVYWTLDLSIAPRCFVP